MRFVAIAIFAVVATGAHADAVVTNWNGYSFGIVFHAPAKPTDLPDEVSVKADEVCRSVNRKAELQQTTQASNFSYQADFICL